MRVLVTGASGQLGAYVLDALAASNHDVIAWAGNSSGNRSGVPLLPIDLTDTHRVSSSLDAARPEAILHLAAISSAAGVLSDPRRARTVNVESTSLLARWCASHERRIVFTSTDLLFSGSRSWNREDDPAEPILAYGWTKRSAELAVIDAPRGLVARMPLMYGPSRCGRPAFFDDAIAALGRGEPRTFFGDEFRTPLDYTTAAKILVLLLDSDASGILHVAGTERVSRFDLMRRMASALGLDPSLVLSNLRSDAPGPEPRPGDVSLDTTRLAALVPGLIRPEIEEAAATWG